MGELLLGLKEVRKMEQEKEIKTSSKKRKILKIVGILFLVALVCMASFAIYVFHSLEPYTEQKKTKQVSVPMDSTLDDISRILEEEGIIRNAKTFYWYARYKDETDFKAGEYTLSPSMEIDTLLEKLKQGKIIENEYTFTIPEGYTVRQIAQLLEDKGFTTRQAFFDALKNGNYSDIWTIAKIPKDKGVKFPLEGFLFPKTYTIKEGASAETIIRTMLEQGAKEIPKEWMTELQKRKVSFYDAMIIASIVERETIAEGERDKVAAVYYNRLKKSMKLQADATIQYVMDKQKNRLLYSDLDLETKYNTYKYEGLPPGPISNPGIESIKAAIFPATHDYLFYVTKKDGSGEHHFSKTFAQHEHYIRLSKKEGK